jgi:hypothetical protein
VLSARAARFLEAALVRWGGTDHVGEPAQMRRAPRGVAGRAAIVSEPNGVAAALGGLASADGRFTRPAEVADGFIGHRGDIDRGQITRAPQARQVDGVIAVSLDALAGLLGQQGRGDDPTAGASVGQITSAPVATRRRFIDKDQVWGLGWHLPTEVITIGLPRAKGAEVDHLSGVILGDIGHRNRFFMDIHSDVQRARLAHGPPPSFCVSRMVSCTMRLWLLASSPAMEPGVSLRIGSHYVYAA